MLVLERVKRALGMVSALCERNAATRRTHSQLMAISIFGSIPKLSILVMFATLSM